MTNKKICNECNRLLSVDNFAKNKKTNDRYNQKCKCCVEKRAIKYPKVCQYCNKDFFSKKKDTKFCSQDCFKKFVKENKKEKINVLEKNL